MGTEDGGSNPDDRLLPVMSNGGPSHSQQNFNDSEDQLETEKQALILLKKLQDLKVWQSKQEERLILEQGIQIHSLQQLSIVQQRERSPLPLNRQERPYVDDDDTTVSSTVYEDDNSSYTEIGGDSDNTWADKNDVRPRTKELNLSSGSVMTLTDGHQDDLEPVNGDDEDYYNQEQNNDIEDVIDYSDETPSPPPNPEEMPVGGVNKSFTQLLNEKLEEEGGYIEDDLEDGERQANGPIKSGSGGNRPFLKRGAGLTRFNLPPDPSKQPSRIKRSKSQPRLGSQDSKSRLIQETVSFTKKKAEPHRIHTSKSLNKLDDPGISGTKISPGVKNSGGSNPALKRSSPSKLKLKSSPTHKRDEAKTVKGKGRAAGKENGSSPGVSPNRHSNCSPTPNGSTLSKSPRSNRTRISKSMTGPGEIGRDGKLIKGGVKNQSSVENSFREKLIVQEAKHENEMKELAVFELLEDAANDTSFCSTSSRVKTLVGKSVLPSPARHKDHMTSSTPMPSSKLAACSGGGHMTLSESKESTSFPASSTPKVYGDNEGESYSDANDDDPRTIQQTEDEVLEPEDDPSLGETLMEEIRKFVMSGSDDLNMQLKGLQQQQMSRNQTKGQGQQMRGQVDQKSGSGSWRRPMAQVNVNSAATVVEDIEDTYDQEDLTNESDDDSTIVEHYEDDNDQDIGKDWRARMMEWDKENHAGGDGNQQPRGAGLLEFSPPSKMPKNSPSYLIWSIFTRDREERRLKALQNKQLSHEGKQQSADYNPKSAPPRLTTADNNTNQALHSKQTKSASTKLELDKYDKSKMAPPVNNPPTEDDIAYQSTLLHMRVVELEQEIDTFKKENTKIIGLKKKLTEEKQRLTKEWEEFEKVRDEGKKKLEEEKKRVRREKLLLEKAQREMDVPKVCSECEGNLNKISKLQQDLSSKETKWNAALTKLQEQLNKVEKVNKNLQTENQRLKLKTVSSKIQSSMQGGAKGEAKVLIQHHGGSATTTAINSSSTPSSDMTPDSGIRSAAPVDSGTNSGLESEDEFLDQELRKSIANTVYETLCADTPRMSYSPADSLESSMTLVSGLPSKSTDVPSSSSQQTLKNNHQVLVNSEKGTKEKRWPDGRLEVWYANGNRKEISPDQKVVKVFYYNGDMKESHSSGLVKYLYSQTQTWHTTHPDGREVLHFSNGQQEVRFPDGSMEITFPDGSIKKIRTDGSEDIWFPDGTRVEVTVDGDRILYLANGQREEHTKDMKKRVYPDGTVKILYSDGRQETRYSNGRVRIKDPQGKLIKDTQPS